MALYRKRGHFLLAIVLVTLFLFGSLFMFATANRNRVIANNSHQIIENTEKLADIIDSEISNGYSNIRILGELVGNSLTTASFDITSIQHLIKNSVFDFMEFADSEGMDHNITGGVSDARDRKYYLDAKAGNTGMELIYNSRATHETLLMFYSPIYYEMEFVGSLVGVYQASARITDLLSDKYFGFNITSYLATDKGRIIACSDGFDPQVEMYLSDLTHSRETVEKAIASGETTTVPIPGNDAGACIVRLKDSGFFIFRIFPQDATDYIISRSNLIVYGLILFVVVIFLGFLFYLLMLFRSTQKEIQVSKQEAEKANAAKTDFLFNMSHDIRTPMNALLGYARLMKKDLTDPKLLDYQEKIEQSGNLLLSIINNVLDLARIESGKMEISDTVIRSGGVIPELVCVFNEDAKKKNVTVEYELNAKTEYFYCDSLKVKEIFLNLVSNAIKYTPSGGKVFVKCTELPSEREGYMVMKTEVIDNGIGMSPDFIPQLFDSFSREHNTTTGKVPGTGLGMSIVKKLVDLMDGTIDVKSEVGKGTHFTVCIPFRIADASTYNSKRELPTSENMGHLNGKRVLIAEDNDLNAEIAIEILSEVGLVVERASDGAECVRMLSESQPGYYDLILMDIQMPNMNGYDATRAIRAMSDRSKAGITIIAMTANAFDEDRKEALDAGMDGHLAKPIDIQALMRVLVLSLKK